MNEQGEIRIFLSYRREDTLPYAHLVFNFLRERFGENVFMDLDSLAPGVDFVEVINQTIDRCDVMVALIGKQWVVATDAAGRRRLDQPEDFVRLELETALSRNIRVVPVLVGGAVMPNSNQLPGDLSKLARRHAFEISDIHLRNDLRALVEALSRPMRRSGGGRRPTPTAEPTGPGPASESGIEGEEAAAQATLEMPARATVPAPAAGPPPAPEAAESEPLLGLEALRRRTEVQVSQEAAEFGPDDPRTLKSRLNLARAKAASGMLQDAVAEFDRYINDVTRVIGPDQATDSGARLERANCVALLGLYDQAIADLDVVVTDRWRTLGPYHPETLKGRYVLGNTIGRAGRSGESIRRLEAVVADSTRTIGATHAETIRAREALASSLAEAGWALRAVSMQEELLPLFDRAFGPSGLFTLTLKIRHSLFQVVIGRIEGGLAAIPDLVHQLVKNQGEQSINVLEGRRAWATSLVRSGRHSEAENLLGPLIADCITLVGPAAPMTLDARLMMARVLQEQEKFEQAQSLLRVLQRNARARVGPTHPLTLQVRAEVARGLAASGHTDDALTLLDEIIPSLIEARGPASPGTLTARRQRASGLAETGRADEAIQELREVITEMLASIGPDAPDMAATERVLAELEAEASPS